LGRRVEVFEKGVQTRKKDPDVFKYLGVGEPRRKRAAEKEKKEKREAGFSKKKGVRTAHALAHQPRRMVGGTGGARRKVVRGGR